MAQVQIPNIPGSAGLRADQNADGSIAYRASLEAGGVAVGPGAPLPVAWPPMASVVSTQLEAAHVLKAGPGTLYALQARATQAGWIQLFDVAAVPADGPVTPRKLWQVSGAGDQRVEAWFTPPLAFSNGIVAVFSSTGPLTKTGAAFGWFSAELA